MRLKHLVTILVLLALVEPAPAHAGGTVTVCDETHLLAALTGGGTVTFSCSGTITLTATITIAADTTIDGSGQTVTISGNHAVPVFFVISGNSGVTLNLNKVTVANGYSINGDGAGIFIMTLGTVTVSDSTFADNSAVYGGGIRNYGTLTVNNSTFSGNRAEHGGGISNTSGGKWPRFGTATVSNSIFSGNRAEHGGGISNTSGGKWPRFGTATVSNSIFSGNRADYYGGAIDNTSGTVTVNNSILSGNSADTGGAIDSSGGTVSLSNSTLSGNSAGAGGGISNEGSMVIVSNSTFAGNSAGRDGGGIRIPIGTVTVSNSTFSGNRASTGGGIRNAEGTVTLGNTIVANSPTGGNCSGYIVDGGGNLSYPETSCSGINSDPKLGPLQDNGGPTWTMALLPGSAALDAANDAICAAPPVDNRDQRGVTRPQGLHCDIGAYEAILQRAFLPLIMR
jgi:hypothetical protein